MSKRLIVFTLIVTFLIGCSANDPVSAPVDKPDKGANDLVSAPINNPDKQEPVIEQDNDEDVIGGEDVIKLEDVILQKGDENEHVKEIQKALIQIAYPIEETGLFDELTMWAITDLQLQQKELTVSGIYQSQTREVIEQMLDDELEADIGSGLIKPEHPGIFTETVENPYEILALINKNYALPINYEPIDLVVPDVLFPFTEDHPKKQLRKEAAHKLEQLFAASITEGLHLFAQSGYRSYDRQEAIFASNVNRHGEDHANTYSARAGESEHQTGLVMDVTSAEVGFDLITEFGETKEGKWLQDHAHEFGFIIRYQEGKEQITGYQYEPWHLRYVGEKAAEEIKENDITLEEYLGAK